MRAGPVSKSRKQAGTHKMEMEGISPRSVVRLENVILPRSWPESYQLLIYTRGSACIPYPTVFFTCKDSDDVNLAD